MPIRAEATFPVTPDQVFAFLIDGEKFGDDWQALTSARCFA